MEFNTATYGSTTVAADRNRVLRNTYALLALTMLPTAAGALLGVSMRFAISPWMGLLLFLGVSFGCFYARIWA